jgi:hypothetical protein
MSNVEKTIIVVLITNSAFSREIAMINPDFRGQVEGEEIFALRGSCIFRLRRMTLLMLFRRKPPFVKPAQSLGKISIGKSS